MEGVKKRETKVGEVGKSSESAHCYSKKKEVELGL
jgi:hypothetical protein